MPAGFNYTLNPIESEKEMCRIETVYRMTGGFNLVRDNLVEGILLPPLTPLSIDFATRKATVVKNVKIVEALAADATSVKIAKGSFAYAGMLLGNGSKGAEIATIEKSGDKYDTITLKAALGATAKGGDVLFEASAAGGTTPKNKANYLNYTWAKVEVGASVTAIGQVFEIKESKLIAPIADVDKTSLGGRFMFI